MRKILFAGCGDLALGCLPAWSKHQVTAIARRPKALPATATFWQGAIDSPAIAEKLHREDWDAIVVTLTPDNPSEEAYRQAYWVNIQCIVHNLAPTAKPLIVFASSTSVYGQTDGSWIDETSETRPDTKSGQCLLDCEAFLRNSGLPVRILRFSGIYGPGRDFLLRQVQAGQGGNQAFTNRIHRDDACGVINLMLQRYFADESDPDVLLVSDDVPVKSQEIRRWLADAMGLSATLTPSDGMRGGDKRCNNHRLRQLGYEFLYPNYQKGYGAMLSSLKK